MLVPAVPASSIIAFHIWICCPSPKSTPAPIAPTESVAGESAEVSKEVAELRANALLCLCPTCDAPVGGTCYNDDGKVILPHFNRMTPGYNQKLPAPESKQAAGEVPAPSVVEEMPELEIERNLLKAESAARLSALEGVQAYLTDRVYEFRASDACRLYSNALQVTNNEIDGLSRATEAIRSADRARSYGYVVRDTITALRAELASKDEELAAAYRAEAMAGSALGDRYAAYNATADPKKLLTFSGWLRARISAAEAAGAELSELRASSVGVRDAGRVEGLREAVRAACSCCAGIINYIDPVPVRSDGFLCHRFRDNGRFAAECKAYAILALIPSPPISTEPSKEAA